jgi:hypothetical protein
VEKDTKDIKAAVYVDSNLIFGNNELILQNNLKDRQMILNNNAFGLKYYEEIDRKLLKQFFEKEDGNKINYEQLEIHAVEFSVKFK